MGLAVIAGTERTPRIEPAVAGSTWADATKAPITKIKIAVNLNCQPPFGGARNEDLTDGVIMGVLVYAANFLEERGARPRFEYRERDDKARAVVTLLAMSMSCADPRDADGLPRDQMAITAHTHVMIHRRSQKFQTGISARLSLSKARCSVRQDSRNRSALLRPQTKFLRVMSYLNSAPPVYSIDEAS